jgi:hypothetical protein
MTGWEAIGLLAAAVTAGAINAVAGGGSLISFPALIAAGYPAKTANVTNTIAVWPGTVGGSLGYREELRGQGWRVVQLSVPSVIGALTGSAVLLATPQTAFDVVVPFLILFACALMAFQDSIGGYTEHHRLAFAASDRIPAPVHVSSFLLGVYGAYFGAAFGIMTLAIYTILLSDSIQRLNALKGVMALIVNGVAVVIFALSGEVEWAPGVLMAAGAFCGGYLGVGVARRLGRTWLRVVVVAYGLVVAGVLFAQLAA